MNPRSPSAFALATLLSAIGACLVACGGGPAGVKGGTGGSGGSGGSGGGAACSCVDKSCPASECAPTDLVVLPMASEIAVVGDQVFVSYVFTGPPGRYRIASLPRLGGTPADLPTPAEVAAASSLNGLSPTGRLNTGGADLFIEAGNAIRYRPSDQTYVSRPMYVNGLGFPYAPQGLTVGGGHYVEAWTLSVLARSLADFETGTLALDGYPGLGNVIAIAAADDAMYVQTVLNTNSALMTEGVYRHPYAGALNATLLAPATAPRWEDSTGGGTFADRIALDGAFVYYLDVDTLSRVPTAGGTAEKLATVAVTEGTWIRVDDQRLYWSDGASIYAARKDGTGIVTLASGSILRLVQDESALYYLTADGAVRRVHK